VKTALQDFAGADADLARARELNAKAKSRQDRPAIQSRAAIQPSRVETPTAKATGPAYVPVRRGELLIFDESDRFLVTTLEHRVWLVFRRSNLRPESEEKIPIKHPRYFCFVGARGEDPLIILSGWFEPAEKYKGVKVLWEEDRQAQKKNPLFAPYEVRFERILRWEAVCYNLQAGETVRPNIRAHRVEGDTWVDVHLEALGSGSAEAIHRRLRALLVSMEVITAPR
jgi:hypothetical protein